MRLPEDDTIASKHVAVFTEYEILLKYVCCAFVVLDNKLCKIRGTCIKVLVEHRCILLVYVVRTYFMLCIRTKHNTRATALSCCFQLCCLFVYCAWGSNV